MFLRANRKARRVPFDQEGGELLAIHLGKYREQVGESAIGDPHLLAVQDVVTAVGREHRPRAAVHGIATGGGFRQSIRTDPLTRGEFRQVLPLLFVSAVPHDGQRADAHMRAERHRKTGQLADGFGNQRGGHLVHFQAAVGFGNIHRHQPKFAGLAQQTLGDHEVFGLDLGSRRHHLVLGEVDCGLGNLPVLLGEVFGCEYVLRIAFLGEETAAFYAFRRRLGVRCCH